MSFSPVPQNPWEGLVKSHLISSLSTQKIAKFGIVVKLVMVNPGSSLKLNFEEVQSQMQSFKILGLLVLKKRFLNVFPIYGHGGHLGHVT